MGVRSACMCRGQQNAITPILQFSKPFFISCCKKIHICLNFL